MKTIVLCVITIFFGIVKPKAQDLPSPPANLQTIPNGSYVIPMDNSLQTNNVIGSGDFNLFSYGLLVHLLNNDVKLKWVIRSGKGKDDIDFSGMAEQIKPSYIAGSVSRNFIAGPFVIFAADTTGVAALIDAFYSSNTLTGNNRPKIFRLSADVANADIRYDLQGFKPKGAILTDGGNQLVHWGYMLACKIPAESYAYASGSDLLMKCFTFASEPHNDLVGPTVDATITAIRRFVEYGGNFLAQCAAVLNYENNSLGRFQTTTGVTMLNANISTNLSYPHPDLSFSQFHGAYHGSRNGSVRNWIMTTGINNEHNHATGTGLNSTAIGASVSKLKSGRGGMVFYVGNHEFNVNQPDGINGIRMYMNAFLTPVSIHSNCKTGQVLTGPLPMKLIAFQGNKNGRRVSLEWTIAENEAADRFELEKSSDGKEFTTAALVFGTEKKGTEQYQFFENLNTDEKMFYRLKMIDKSQQTGYSKTLVLQSAHAVPGSFPIISNPVNDKLVMTLSSPDNQASAINIYNTAGQKMLQQQLILREGHNLVSLQLPGHMMAGVYIAEVVNQSGRQTARFVKQ